MTDGRARPRTPPRFDVSTADAIALMVEAVRPMPAEPVSVARALRRVLARDLASLADRPSADDSALDGFACREADTLSASPAAPVRLRHVGASLAGRPFTGSVAAGEAVGIATGAAVPAGADAVVGVEDATQADGWVVVSAPASPAAVRSRARDLATGETYLRVGGLLDAANLGLAAAMGHATVYVARRPRVAVLVTGDELVPPGGTLRPGDVYDANFASLTGLLDAAGAELTMLARVGDEPGELEAAVEAAAAGGVDLVLTSGGVSRGERDAVRDLLIGRGALVFWRVTVRPGGPTMFGHLGEVPVIGLPGNPVSSVVTFLVFARAYLDTALGRSAPLPYHDRTQVTAGGEFVAGAKEVLHRSRLVLDGLGRRAEPFEDQSSAVLRSLSQSQALVVTPPGRRYAAGDLVEAIDLAPHLGR